MEVQREPKKEEVEVQTGGEVGLDLLEEVLQADLDY